MRARDAVLESFHAACARVDLASRVRGAMGDDRERIVIAAGKAATKMFAGIEEFSRALVVIPRGSPAPPSHPRVTVLHSAHPLPDEDSILAAEAALVLAASDAPHERVFLISGGASSLWCAPREGITLEQKCAVTRALLHADAPITDINTVRRHLSRIKGGALALACGRNARRTLIVSDVINGRAHDVASGPTVFDPTTIEDAKRISERHDLPKNMPFGETSKSHERFGIIAEPALFASLMRDELTRRGFSNAEVTMCEPTLRIPIDAGFGGRCTHTAAIASLTLKRGELFAAIATDGVDGNSNTAGAIVDAPIDGAREAIASFDTGSLHIHAGTAIPSAPTGLNFTDVHVRIN